MAVTEIAKPQGRTLWNELRARTRECGRCGRKLTNPHSIARSLGPVCYRKAGGGVFDGDLNASEAEWARREQLLRHGGEHDFGWWDCVYTPPDGEPMILRRAMLVSVRYRDGMYEAFGDVMFQGCHVDERVFYRGPDIREAWRAAIAAGPESNAAAYRAEREIARQWKAQLRGGGRRVR